MPRRFLTATATVLLGLATSAQGQTTSPYFGNPSALPSNPTIDATQPAAAIPQANPDPRSRWKYVTPEELASPATQPVSTPSLGTAPLPSSVGIGLPPSPSWPANLGTGPAPNAPPAGTPAYGSPYSSPVGTGLPSNTNSGAAYGAGNVATSPVPTPPSPPVSSGMAGPGVPGSELGGNELLQGTERLRESIYAPNGAGNNHLWIQADLLTWAVSRPSVTTIGDPASEGIVNVAGNSYFRSNSLDTGFITSDWNLGGRIDFGRMEDRHGWSASVLFYDSPSETTTSGAWFVPSDPDGLLLGYQDGNNDNVDDDVNGNQIHGRSGQDLGTADPNNPGSFIAPFDGTPDQGAPIDTGDLVSWLVTFSSVTTSNTASLTGFELMDVYRPHGWGVNTVDWSWGLRYLELQEQFGVTGSGGTLDSSSWAVDSDNDILGPQIGVRWEHNREWFRFTAEGRFMTGLNFQQERLNGALATGIQTGGVNQPVALEPTSFNASLNSTQFSPVGEWRIEASYYAARWLALRLGYTGMVIGGVSRASNQVSYTLPNFTLAGGGNDAVLVNGLNFGLEINR